MRRFVVWLISLLQRTVGLKPAVLVAASVVDPSIEVFMDVDEIITKSFNFRMHGKIHTIKPVHLDEFMKVSNAMAGLWATADKASTPTEDLLKKYFEIIHAVCDTVTMDDLRKLELSQLGGLYQGVVDKISGKIDAKYKETTSSTEKKNI